MTSTCGTHACGCGSASDSDSASDQAEVARINGVALHAAGAQPPGDMLRQRACTELLRQQAQRQGLLAEDDAPGLDGATSAAAAQAIERLLEQALQVPEPSEAACRRYHAAHPGFGSQGERAHLRHVLFAVTPGVDVSLLRQRAERLLLELRCADDGGPRFAEAAGEWSNCPSGAQGGDLGWLTPEDCAPEFAREVFGSQEVGVLARLAHSRFGLGLQLGRFLGAYRRQRGIRQAQQQPRRKQSFQHSCCAPLVRARHGWPAVRTTTRVCRKPASFPGGLQQCPARGLPARADRGIAGDDP